MLLSASQGNLTTFEPIYNKVKTFPKNQRALIGSAYRLASENPNKDIYNFLETNDKFNLTGPPIKLNLRKDIRASVIHSAMNNTSNFIIVGGFAQYLFCKMYPYLAPSPGCFESSEGMSCYSHASLPDYVNTISYWVSVVSLALFGTICIDVYSKTEQIYSQIKYGKKKD